MQQHSSNILPVNPMTLPLQIMHARVSNQRLQELLCQTPGYGASLTEDCNKQRVHESLYQTHVQILKVLSEGVKTQLKKYHHPSSEAQIKCVAGGPMMGQH